MRPRAALVLALVVALGAAAGCREDGPAGPDPDPGAEGLPGLGAGAPLNGRPLFPADNPWNQDVSGAPVDPNSATLIASCGAAGLRPDFGTWCAWAPWSTRRGP